MEPTGIAEATGAQCSGDKEAAFGVGHCLPLGPPNTRHVVVQSKGYEAGGRLVPTAHSFSETVLVLSREGRDRHCQPEQG